MSPSGVQRPPRASQDVFFGAADHTRFFLLLQESVEHIGFRCTRFSNRKIFPNPVGNLLLAAIL